MNYQYKYSAENFNKQPERGNSPNTKNDQPTQYNFRSSQNVLNHIPDEDEPENNNNNMNNNNNNNNNYDEEGKLRRQIMEKDKIIYEYTRILKETERNLENSKKQCLAKDETINKIKDENKEFRFKMKNLEQHLERKEEELRKFRTSAEERILILSKEKNFTEDKLNENTRCLEQNQVEQQNYIFENSKLEKQIHKLTEIIDDKSAQLINAEKLIDDLKRDNKIIPSLKKQIFEIENLYGELQKTNQSEMDKNEILSNEKNELENKLAIIQEKTSGENSVERLRHGMMKYAYELENKNNVIEEKDNELQAIDNKYKNLSTDNDNFVTMINSEIGDLMLLFESLQFNRKNDIQYTSKGQANQGKFTKNSQLGFKYELINKNIEIFRNKMMESHQVNSQNIFKLEKSLKETERMYKEIFSERDNLLKENSLRQNSLNEIKEKYSNIVNDHDKLKEIYSNLKDNHHKLKNEFEDLLKKYETISTDIQEFMKSCFAKLKDKFPINRRSNKEKSFKEAGKFSRLEEEILNYIDVLVADHSTLISTEKDLLDKCKLFQMQINSVNQEKININNQMNELQDQKDNELRRLEESKNEEIRLHRENLYEKISSLTNLLETSNKIINETENENMALKDKLEKLEHNLDMITKSHLELENSIANNFNCLSSEIEDKEYRYNNLLREIELKDMHIGSMENILRRKDEEIEKLKDAQKLLYTYSCGEENDYEKRNKEDRNTGYNQNNNINNNMNNQGNQNIGYNDNIRVDNQQDNKVPGRIFKRKK